MDSHLLAEQYLPIPEALRDHLSGDSVDVPEFDESEAGALSDYRVAVVASHGPELPEFHVPFNYLTTRGVVVDVITQDWLFDFQRQAPGMIVLVEWLAPRVCVQADKKVSEAAIEDYDAVVLLGGAWNPILLRTDDGILNFIRDAHRVGCLVAAVCHGPQPLINAKTFPEGTRATGVADIRQDMTNAGFDVADEAVIYDAQERLITARDPQSLAEFCQEIRIRLLERSPRRL